MNDQLQSYSQSIFNKGGKGTQLIYIATFGVKPHRCLEITHKDHRVETPEEVEREEAPKKALNKLSR